MTTKEQEEADVCYRRISQKMEVIADKFGVSQKEIAEVLIDFGRLPLWKRLWIRFKLWYS